ncbi:3-hydroxybutyrate dehydrogenase [Aliihoeflea sp. PC F10.4]
MKTMNARTAVVTGSTSGIGLAIARSLAGKGFNLVLNSYTNDEADTALAEKLAEEFGVKAIYVSADMSKAADCRALIEKAAQASGTVDLLVNNAGIQHVAPIDKFPTDQWDRIIAINLSSAFHTTAAVLPLMRKAGWGRIVNIASAHGLRASVNKSAYVAAKHGIVGFTKVTALETAGEGITANAVCPGFVLTPLVEKQIEDLIAETGESRDDVVANRILQKQPSKQFATVEEIGGTVAFLASDDAAQITGTTISVDGGWTAQ